MEYFPSRMSIQCLYRVSVFIFSFDALMNEFSVFSFMTKIPPPPYPLFGFITKLDGSDLKNSGVSCRWFFMTWYSFATPISLDPKKFFVNILSSANFLLAVELYFEM